MPGRKMRDHSCINYILDHATQLIPVQSIQQDSMCSVLGKRNDVLEILGTSAPPSAQGLTKLESRCQLSSYHSQLKSPRSQPTLSTFPPVSPISGRREYRPLETPLFRKPHLNTISPLENGHNVYGNYLSSPLKSRFALSTRKERRSKSPAPESSTQETPGEFFVKNSTLDYKLNSSTCVRHHDTRKEPESRSLSPASSSYGSIHLYKGQTSPLKIPTVYGMHPPTTLSTSNGFGDVQRRAEKQVNEAFKEHVRTGQNDLSTWSKPSKPYYMPGYLKMNDYDNESILTTHSVDDEFKDPEGLQDSVPYTKLRQKQQVKRIRAIRARNRTREEEKRQARLTRHPWAQDYELGSTGAPGDSINQLEYPNYLRSPRSIPVFAQGPAYEQRPSADMNPQPLLSPPGCVTVIVSTKKGKVVQKPAYICRLVSKVSRFLLSAPSDSALKTYSTHSPPYDSSSAETKIPLQEKYTTNRKNREDDAQPITATTATPSAPPMSPQQRRTPRSIDIFAATQIRTFPGPRRPALTVTSARYEPSMAESEVTVWPEEDSARNVIVTRARPVMRGGGAGADGTGSMHVAAPHEATVAATSPFSSSDAGEQGADQDAKRKTGARRKWREVNWAVGMLGLGPAG